MTPNAHPSHTTEPPRRTVLDAWMETRGLVGGHTAASRPVELRTEDGVRLAATYLPGPRAADLGPAAVLLHGFAAHRRKPRYAWLADELATRMSVLAIDLRGHGQSTGTSHLGTVEHRDLAAALAHLRELGHPWVATVGASMGATTTVQAATHGVAGDAAVLISGPAWIELWPRSAPMERLRRIWHAPGGPRLLRGMLGVTVADHRSWRPPHHPADVADQLPRPSLVVHGDDDEWFSPEHGIALARAGHEHWREPAFGHAEDGFEGAFGRRLADALRTAATTGRFPRREETLWHG